KSLLSAVQASPSSLFNVIVKGKLNTKTTDVTTDVNSAIKTKPGNGKGIKRQYSVVSGVSAQLTGSQILVLASDARISSIVTDGRVVAHGTFSNLQLWPDAAGLTSLWSSSLAMPAIAVVDSGVDATRAADFGVRVITQQDFTNGGSNSKGDGYGHGTFVASIAAGGAAGYTGAAPGANIVSLDVLDDSGAGYVSDVIQACDWIYRNKGKYGIRVANLSLTGSDFSSFMYDPLDAAVEKLWFSGVVVVNAAGNYGTAGMPSGILYAPANDPFAITVGAADISGTVLSADDFAAPWSAYGSTLDGFRKPELGAPGRYLNGAVAVSSTMYALHPERIVAPGYFWMSGTSFAAPVVAGAATQILATHPDWTPDEVKGALMLTALPYTDASSYTLGVGEVNAAVAVSVVNPPNPNAALDAYVTTDPNGGQAFDAASWSSAANSNASWSSASWSSASWSSASWSSASWSSASWSSASWSSASWSSGQTTDGQLPSASWSSLTWLN
ncbi:MAG: S8 family serine peptidase, partial [Actinomycetota bacterium]|nr:S8 family serine peptidase [Actinomycetota bacterium]